MKVHASSSSSSLWLVLLVCSSIQLVVDGCNPCAGALNPDKDIEGITCSVWENVNKLLDPISDECYKQRILGQYYCDCPSNTPVVCGCPAGTELLEGDINRLDGTDVTCETAAFIPAIDGELSCHIFETSCCETIGEIDGTCTLCKVRGNYPNDVQKKILGRSESCGQFGGRPVLGDSNCHEENFNSTIDEAAYCGCPRITPPNICEVCPGGQTILQSTASIELVDASGTIFEGEIIDRPVMCRDIGDIAPFVVDSSVCRALKVQAIQSNCCGYSDGDVQGYTPPATVVRKDDEPKSGKWQTTSASAPSSTPMALGAIAVLSSLIVSY